MVDQEYRTSLKHLSVWLTQRTLCGSITQTELARMLDVTQQTISSYMRGEKIPKMTILKKIQRAFGVTPERFWEEMRALDAALAAPSANGET